MREEPLDTDFHAPIYNIKAVARLVGLLPVTLRAWERRYGLPAPQRGDQGYRLYSEHDVRTLRWLKNQVDAGLSIGRASVLLHELRSKGQDPAVDTAPIADQPTTPDVLRQQLMFTLAQYNESGALETLSRAFSLYPLDQVLVDVIQPVMVEIGEKWHAGEVTVAMEHFATQFFMQHLMSMLAAAGAPVRPGTIVAGCAPGETHQIGLLMLVVMLRWRGWDVKYLGANMSLENLVDALEPMHPRLLMFTATRAEAAAALRPLKSLLLHFPAPAPQVVLGGQAFQQHDDAVDLPGEILSGSPKEMVHAIEVKLSSQVLSHN
jgi:MerR family transcriptional regulator, light-induced transcriptional regulator